MAQRCGLSKGYFRPSDDAVTLSYHVPSQAMTVVEVRSVHFWGWGIGNEEEGPDSPCTYIYTKQLRHIAAMLPIVFPPSTTTNSSKQVSTTPPPVGRRASELAARAAAVADEMDAAIRVEAMVPVLRVHRRHGGTYVCMCRCGPISY